MRDDSHSFFLLFYCFIVLLFDSFIYFQQRAREREQRDRENQNNPYKNANGVPPPPAVAPTGWWAAVDNATGRMYYYNRRTQETSWTIPEGLTKDQIRMNNKTHGTAVTKQITMQ